MQRTLLSYDKLNHENTKKRGGCEAGRMGSSKAGMPGRGEARRLGGKEAGRPEGDKAGMIEGETDRRLGSEETGRR